MSALLNRKDKTRAILLALFLSFLLHFFLPLTDFIYLKIARPFVGEVSWLRLGFFPWSALLVYLSIKPKWNWAFPNLKFLFLSTPLPLFISYVFGHLSHWPGTGELDFNTIYWYVFCIPIGEEFLFRGWAFEIFERHFPKMKITRLMDFPVSAWMTSLMFSLWHFQNLPQNPLSLVLFQVVYTFFTGLWLVQMRIRCKNPLPSCIAHSLLNLAATFS